MNTWSTIALITRREVAERSRSKAFLVSLAFAILLIVGLILVPAFLSSRGIDYDLGVLGTGGDEIVETARTLAIDDAPDRDVTFEVSTFTTEAEADSALAAGDVELVLVDGTEMRRQSSSGFGGSDLEFFLQRAAASADLAGALEGTDKTVDEIRI